MSIFIILGGIFVVAAGAYFFLSMKKKKGSKGAAESRPEASTEEPMDQDMMTPSETGGSQTGMEGDTSSSEEEKKF